MTEISVAPDYDHEIPDSANPENGHDPNAAVWTLDGYPSSTRPRNSSAPLPTWSPDYTPPPPEPNAALIASARQIKIGDRGEYKRARDSQQAWYPAAWQFFDAVGEMKSALYWKANLISKVPLFIAHRPDPSRRPTPLPTNHPLYQSATAALARLSRPSGSHASLLRKLTLNWDVVGDAYLLGLDRNSSSESWSIRSTTELSPISSGRWKLLKDPDTGKPRTIEEANNFILRLWVEHPADSFLSDSLVRGVLEPAELLLYISRLIRAVISQTLQGGIIKLPSELIFASPDASKSEDPTEHPFLARLIEAILSAQQDASLDQAAPLLVTGPGEVLKNLEHLVWERPLDELLDKFIERSLRRLAQGLPVPNEVVLGMQDIAGWNAWKIDEQGFSVHLEPTLNAEMQMFTFGYLWPSLGIDDPSPDSPIIWYDPTVIIARPDRSADYDNGLREGSISPSAWRAFKGMSETEAPTQSDLISRAVRTRGNLDAFTTDALIRLLFPDIHLGATRPNAQIGPSQNESPSATYPPAASTPTESAPLYPSRSHTVPINPSSPAPPLEAFAQRLHGSIDSTLRRAVDRAGSRLRTAVQKDRSLTARISGIQNSRVAAVLGSADVSAIRSTQQLIDGLFTELRESFHLFARALPAPSERISASWSELHASLTSLFPDLLYSLPDSPDALDELLLPIVNQACRTLTESS